MTDEVSLGKAKMVLLPIIFGLVILFFLKLFSIKLPFWIWIVLLIAIVIISLLLSMRSRLALTSHLPSLSFENILWFIVIIVVIATIIFAASLLLSNDSRQEIYYEDGSLERDEYEEPWICKDVEWKNIDITTNDPDWGFYLIGIPKGESVNCVFTLEDDTQKCEVSFVVNSPADKISGARVSFGVINSNLCKSQDKGLVRVFVNGVCLRTESVNNRIPTRFFATNGQKYNATLEIQTNRPCVVCQKIGSGNFKRTELINQGKIGVIKLDF